MQSDKRFGNLKQLCERGDVEKLIAIGNGLT